MTGSSNDGLIEWPADEQLIGLMGRLAQSPCSISTPFVHGRSGSMGHPNAHTCHDCGHDLVEIGLLVDGSNLQMFSCDQCDKRSWRRGGVVIDLADALGEFEQHSGRRR